MSVAVFVSGGGSNMQTLIDANFDIKLVISSAKNAYALERAKNHNIDGFYVGKRNFEDIDAQTDEIMRLLEEYKIEYIVLAGYLSIITEKLISKYEHKIINIHPSLIPSFCGMGYYGHHVHEGVYNSGVKVTGATVHFVNQGVDTGEIILQDTVCIENTDTPDTIAQKVLKIEHKILPKALDLLINDRITVKNGRTYIK
ncbi:MAG: phosphoribosylglycinamide formyltransferase [Clostridia bacterium]